MTERMNAFFVRVALASNAKVLYRLAETPTAKFGEDTPELYNEPGARR
jgi:hypothetical protein